MERRVGTVNFQQFFVSTDLDQATKFNHHNSICLTERAQPVCDRDRRPATREIFQGFLNLAFRGRIQCRSRFIQDQNAGINQQGPCNTDALAFATR